MHVITSIHLPHHLRSSLHTWYGLDQDQRQTTFTRVHMHAKTPRSLYSLMTLVSTSPLQHRHLLLRPRFASRGHSANQGWNRVLGVQRIPILGRRVQPPYPPATSAARLPVLLRDRLLATATTRGDLASEQNQTSCLDPRFPSPVMVRSWPAAITITPTREGV